MTTVEMQDITFQIGKLPAKKQFHVSRRIAPIIPALLPIYVGLARGGSLMATLEQSPEILKPFAEALAGMPDDAVDYLIDTCMSVVKRQQGSGWANIWSPGGPMFDDIDLSLLLPLTVRVITVNLGPFISGLLTSQSSSPASQAQAG